MNPSVTAPLKKALTQLEAEKQRINREITTLRAALEVLGGNAQRPAAPVARPKAKRRRMSAAARRAVSLRMKASWAKRKAAAGKGKAKVRK